MSLFSYLYDTHDINELRDYILRTNGPLNHDINIDDLLILMKEEEIKNKVLKLHPDIVDYFRSYIMSIKQVGDFYNLLKENFHVTFLDNLIYILLDYNEDELDNSYLNFYNYIKPILFNYINDGLVTKSPLPIYLEFKNFISKEDEMNILLNMDFYYFRDIKNLLIYPESKYIIENRDILNNLRNKE